MMMSVLRFWWLDFYVGVQLGDFFPHVSDFFNLVNQSPKMGGHISTLITYSFRSVAIRVLAKSSG